MTKKQKKCNKEYKIQAVKLFKKIGGAKAAAKFGILIAADIAGKAGTLNYD